MKGIVIVPAYNEEQVIEKVLLGIPRIIGGHNLDILVVNDGSSDHTAKKVRLSKVKCVTHPINRGLGAALGTGFEYARNKSYDFLVTLDGDGQHDPKEIIKLIRPIFFKKADFVVGTRIKRKGMPATRRVLTFSASLITYIFTGVWTNDSQSGFRGFSRRAIENIRIEVDRMEVSSDFFRQAKEKNLRIQEVSIRPIYTKYSLEKGQNFLNSFNIIGKLALRRLMM